MAHEKLNKKSLLVIIGPTAIGKTSAALEIAKKFNGELISADSRQVYKGLDIATGKIMPGRKVEKKAGRWIVDSVPIHLFDVVEPQQQFSVADFVTIAKEKIAEIWAAGKLPIVVGGTGFYLNGLLRGFASLGVKPDFKLRQQLEEKTVQQLLATLASLNPKKAKSLNLSDRANRRRLTRAIEIEKSKSSVSIKPLDFESVLIVGLAASNKHLFQRIDLWVEKSIKLGMVDEARQLHTQGLSFKRMEDLGLEYYFLAKLLEGEISGGQFEVQLKSASHAFARRQKTYFKKFEKTIWFDIEKADWLASLSNTILRWYNKQ